MKGLLRRNVFNYLAAFVCALVLTIALSGNVNAASGDVTDPVTLSLGEQWYSGTFSGTETEYWYEFTMPAAGQVTFTLSDSSKIGYNIYQEDELGTSLTNGTISSTTPVWKK